MAYESALEHKRRVEGRPGPAITTLFALGRTLNDAGRFEEAIAIHRERLRVIGELPERDAQVDGVARHDLADALLAPGRVSAAIDIYTRAVELKNQGDGPAEDLATTLVALGQALTQAGLFHRAISAYQRGLESLEGLDDRQDASEAGCWELIAQSLLECGEVDDASSAFERASEAYERAHWTARVGRTRLGLAVAELANGRQRAAAAAAGSAVDAFDQDAREGSVERAWALVIQAQAQPGHPESSLAHLSQAWTTVRAYAYERPWESVPGVLATIAMTYDSLGHRDLAVAVHPVVG